MKKVFKKTLMLSFLASICFITACNSVKHNVLKDVNKKYKMKSVLVIEDSNSIKAPAISVFAKTLYSELADEGFQRNSNAKLKIKFKFVEYDEGSRAGRAFLGWFGVGRGNLKVEVSYMDDKNNVLAVTSVKAVYKAGFFGGNFENAIVGASKDVAEYTIKNFK